MSKKIKKPKDTSVSIPQRDKLKNPLQILERNDLTDKQQRFLELVTDKHTRVVFVNGPAGTAKTYLAALAGLRLLDAKKVSDILYFRSIVESSADSLGSLPGELEDKFGPFAAPLEEKLEELLPKCDIQALKKEKRVEGLPINFLRGRSFNVKYIIADEAQNMRFKELNTLMTRLGKFSKMIILGDSDQIDLKKREESGLMDFYHAFDTETHKQAGIHTFEFGEEDIVRDELLKLICNTIKHARAELGK